MVAVPATSICNNNQEGRTREVRKTCINAIDWRDTREGQWLDQHDKIVYCIKGLFALRYNGDD